jgi:hypothetical protein
LDIITINPASKKMKLSFEYKPNQRTFTIEEFAEIIDRPVEDVHSLLREGLPKNADGTIDLVYAVAWELKRNPPSDSGNALYDAGLFLTDILYEGRVAAKEVMRRARAEEFSERTVVRAKKELGIKSKKVSGEWFWELPPED